MNIHSLYPMLRVKQVSSLYVLSEYIYVSKENGIPIMLDKVNGGRVVISPHIMEFLNYIEKPKNFIEIKNFLLPCHYLNDKDVDQILFLCLSILEKFSVIRFIKSSK